MTTTPLPELITQIATQTNKTPEEISALISAKVTKFSGLLTEQGAAFMVQKELGIHQDTLEHVTVGQLTEGMKGIELKGTIVAVFPLKEFDKAGKKGRLKSFVISDGTGEIRVTLWNDQVDAYELTKGSELTLSNVLISKYNEKLQATLGFNGALTITKKQEEVFEKLATLTSGLTSVNLVGRIIRKFPQKEFTSNDRKGKLASFQFGDETAVLRATAWNDTADVLEKFREGDPVEIKNAYTKEGKFGVELHLGYTTIITLSTKSVPPVAQILKDSVVEKTINQLVDGESATIIGGIMSVEQGKFVFEVCAKCGKKITKTPNGVLCETCGETTAKKNAVVSFLLEDPTSGIKATLFGTNALTAIEMTQEALEEALTTKSTDVLIAELNAKLTGKKLKLYGYQKTNTFSGANEFMVREVLA